MFTTHRLTTNLSSFYQQREQNIRATATRITERHCPRFNPIRWSDAILRPAQLPATISAPAIQNATVAIVAQKPALTEAPAPIVKISKVAIQQALLLVCGASERETARLTGAKHHRTVWNRAKNPISARVKAWDARDEAERNAVIVAAWALIDADFLAQQ